MPKVHVYNLEGKMTGDLELDAKFFGVKPDAELVHGVVVAQMANARTHTGNVKKRGEVRGGGIKPWKQKGTGRARQGSIRAPQWVGGGIAHGPTKDRNFSVKVNRKVKRKALFMALSDKVANEKFVVVEAPAFAAPKTKLAATMLKKLPLGHRTLMVIPSSNPTLLRMVRNIQDVKLITVNALSVADVVRYPSVLFQKDAVPAFEALYGAEAK